LPEALNQQIDRLQEIVNSDRDPEGRAFVPLADAYRRAGDLDRALEVVSEGLGALPDSASAHVVSGWLCRDLGDDDGAMRSFERVLELDDENGMALRALAELVEPVRGLAFAERMVELDPDDSDAMAVLEGVRSALEVSAEADEVVALLDEVDETVVLDGPTVPIADLAPAVEPEAEPEVEDAGMEAAVEVAAEAPSEIAEPADEPSDQAEAEIYTQTLAELYAKQGATDKAVEVYRKLLVDDPDNGMFLHRIAELTRGVAPAPVVEETDDRPAVPIESLAPDVEMVVQDDRPVVPIESLAPDPEAQIVDDRPVVPIDSLAPDPPESEAQEPVVTVEDLAPDGEPVATFETDATVDAAEAMQDDRPVVPFESLAPDASSEGPDEDPCSHG
jgi:tetratricopeptide (TPR) repeat protein